MTNFIVKHLLHTLESHKIIKETELPYYQYAFSCLFEALYVHIPCLLYAHFHHQKAEYLIFYTIITILRMYGGGFHFRNYLPCFLTSLVSIITVLHITRKLTLHSLVSALLCIGMLGLIHILAPVPSVIEHWSFEEFTRRRQKLLYILLFLSFLTILLLLTEQTRWLHLFLSTFTFMAAILAAGKLRLYYYQHILPQSAPK